MWKLLAYEQRLNAAFPPTPPLETETHMAYELQHTVLVSSLVRGWLTGLAVTVSSFGWKVNVKETRHNTSKHELKATRNAVKPPGLFRSKCVWDFSRHGRGVYRADTPQQRRGFRRAWRGVEEQSGGDLLFCRVVSALSRLHAHPVWFLHGAGGRERPSRSVWNSFCLLWQDVRRHGWILSWHARRLASSALGGWLQTVSIKVKVRKVYGCCPVLTF